MKKYRYLLFLFLISGFTSKALAQATATAKSLADSAARRKGMLQTIDFTTKALSNTYNHKAMGNLFEMRGQAEAGLKRYAKAIDDLTKALFFNPDLKDAYAYRAACYEYSKQYLPAIKDYQKTLGFIKGYPEQSAILYNCIARAHLGLHNYKKAVEADSTAIALEPKFGEAYVNRGWAYLASAKYEKALADFKTGIDAFGNDMRAISAILAGAGDANRHLKNYREAINNYSLAIKVNPYNKSAYWYRGICYNLNGDYKLADDDYSKTIAFYKNDRVNLSILYADRARVEMGQIQYAKAIRDDSLAISLDGRSPGHYFERGSAYAQNGDYKLSNEDYQKAISLSPNDRPAMARLYNALANNDYALADYKKVIDDCNSSLALDNKGWSPYVYRGRAYLKLQQKDEAMKDFSQSLALDTTKASVDYAYALFYTGNNDRAIDVMQTNVLSTNDDSVLLNYYYNFACLYSLMSRPDEANTYLKKCIEGGYAKKYVLTDPDLENIRNTQEFKDMTGTK